MLEENKKENIEQKSEEAPVKKKKLAVVFHSQNSVNHKNHPMGRTQFCSIFSFLFSSNIRIPSI